MIILPENHLLLAVAESYRGSVGRLSGLNRTWVGSSVIAAGYHKRKSAVACGVIKSRSMWFATRWVVCSLNRAGRSPHRVKLKNPVSPSKDVQRTQSFKDEHAAIAIP